MVHGTRDEVVSGVVRLRECYVCVCMCVCA